MSEAEIIEKQSMNLVQVKEELEKIKKRDGELDIRGNKAEEYATAFCKLSAKEAAELYSAIDKLQIPRFKDQHINKIIDIMPISLAHLKVVLQGFAITISQENLKKLFSVIEKHQKKK